MYKSLILVLITSSVLFANLNQKALNLLGKDKYYTNKGLIDFILKDSNITYTSMVEKLKRNNLLDLKFNKKKQLNITFKLNDSSSKSMIITKKVLKSLGYYKTVTKNLEFLDNSIIWDFTIETKAAIDPLYISKAFNKRNSYIRDIIKEGENKYTYYIDTSKAKFFRTYQFENGSNVLSLKKISKGYFLAVNENEKLNIQSIAGNRWHPNIVFYDDKLNIIEIQNSDNFTKNLSLKVPENTKYLKINDLYSLNNLRRGIYITKELINVSRN